MRSIAVGRSIARVGSIGSEGHDGSGSAHHHGELLHVCIEDFVGLRVDEETDNAETTGILHTTGAEDVERLTHRHTATHLSGEPPFALRSFAHGIDDACHVVVVGLRRIGFV